MASSRTWRTAVARPAEGAKAQLAGGSGRRDPGAKQGLAHVDVAQSRHQALIEQEGLRPASPPGEGPGEIRAVERLAQRFGTHAGKARVRVQGGCDRQVHEAETSRIEEGDPVSRLSDEKDVRMSLQGRRGQVGGRGSRRPAWASTSTGGDSTSKRPVIPRWTMRVSPRSRGASRYLPRLSNELDPRSGEASGEAVRKRKAQIGAPGFDLPQARADQERGQAPAHGLDLWEFGHRSRLAVSRARSKRFRMRSRRLEPKTRFMNDIERQNGVAFGFQTVDRVEKPRLVREVFDRVARATIS